MAFLRWFAAVFALALAPAIGAAAGGTYYVDAQNGSDAGSGGAADPWRTLSHAIGSAGAGSADGDTLYLAGTFREKLALISPGVGVTIAQWPGMPRAIVRGDVLTALSDWTYTGTPGVFEIALPPGTCDHVNDRTLPEGIATVVVDWDSSIDAAGRHYGHLTRAQGLADCAMRPDSWWFAPSGTAGVDQDGSGTIRIHLAEGYVGAGALHASGHVIAYCLGNRNGIEIGTLRYKDSNYTQGDFAVDNPLGCRGFTLDGVWSYLWPDNGWRTQYGLGGLGVDVGEGTNIFVNSMGYAIRPADFVNSTVRNVKTIDGGYHGCMFVGHLNHGNTFEDSEIWGGHGNPTSGGSSSGFFVSNYGPGDKSIHGCRVTNVTVQKYTLLGRQTETVGGLEYAVPIQFPFDRWGAPVYTTCTYDGFIHHTTMDSASNRVADVEYTDCAVVESGRFSDNSMCVGAAFKGGHLGNLTWDPTNVDAYPVRFRNCAVLNAAHNLTDGTTHLAFDRCRIHLARHGALFAEGGALGSGSGAHSILFSACEIVDGMGHAGGGSRHTFQASFTNRLYLVNCSVYGVGEESNARNFFNFLSGVSGSRVFARACIFGYADDAGGPRRFLTMGTTPNTAELNPSVFDIADCWYFGLADGFVASPGPATQAQWQSTWAGAGMDPAGVYTGDASPFADPSGASLELTAWARDVRKLFDHAAPVGINGRVFSGNYGAYQYRCTADHDDNDFVNGDDFDAFVADFEAGLPAADIDGNTFVNGEDFDLFVSRFMAGC